MDESLYLVFLETYYKGDQGDLCAQEYKVLDAEAKSILLQPMQFEWE